jgi:hypothetical protein|tara:strand:- start:1914 stop:2138 length:225 start_codon:yes stop_codon:yes gene_type:complete
MMRNNPNIPNKHLVNGGLYDRGTCDSYYRRPAYPHYYPHGTYHGKRIVNLTPYQEKIYMKGYNDNESDGFYKEW